MLASATIRELAKSGSGRNEFRFVRKIVRLSFVPTPDEYRRLAAECLELAPKISPDLRATFIALAQGWANLAEVLEKEHSILPDAPDSPPIFDDPPDRDPDDSGEDWCE